MDGGRIDLDRGGEQDDRTLGAGIGHALEDLLAGATAQRHVEQDGVEARRGHGVEGFLGRADGDGLELAAQFEHQGDESANVLVVVDDQQRAHEGTAYAVVLPVTRFGSRMVVTPARRVLRTAREPSSLGLAMDQAAIDAHLAERRRTVAGKGAERLRELNQGGGDDAAFELELHRLAGTLGTFGMQQASFQARSLLVAVREGSLVGVELHSAVASLIAQLEEAS